MPGLRQPPDSKRRIPRQARAAETVAAILEAAAQILEARGPAGFTTNAVADRAGVSIGTLYQYFDDKNAILLALARQQTEATLAAVRAALLPTGLHDPETRVRAMVRAIVNAFGGRLKARRAVVQAVLAQGAGLETMRPVAAFLASAGAVAPHIPLTEEQVFVLSRALLGTIRAAVLEEQTFLGSRAFEDEIVRLVLAYVAALASR